MTTFYKIRHIETGKFYSPVKGYSWEKTNLTKGGKVYTKKPTLKHIGHGYSIKTSQRSFFVRLNGEEDAHQHFEIVTYKMVEVPNE